MIQVKAKFLRRVWSSVRMKLDHVDVAMVEECNDIVRVLHSWAGMCFVRNFKYRLEGKRDVLLVEKRLVTVIDSVCVVKVVHQVAVVVYEEVCFGSFIKVFIKLLC